MPPTSDTYSVIPMPSDPSPQRAKRSQLIALIRDLRDAVIVEASGGEGKLSYGEVARILARANRILQDEADQAHRRETR